MREYHDTEWGVPLWDDKRLFEFILLDAFQAGLSWATILMKRSAFREAFDDFDYYKIAQYDEAKFNELMLNANIIRNKAKINSAITNAQATIKIIEEKGSFAEYLWEFTNGKPIVNNWQSISQVPASSKESDKMSADLKARGFKFVGTTICYAFMQAAGMINDHLVTCFRYNVSS